MIISTTNEEHNVRLFGQQIEQVENNMMRTTFLRGKEMQKKIKTDDVVKKVVYPRQCNEQL